MEFVGFGPTGMVWKSIFAFGQHQSCPQMAKKALLLTRPYPHTHPYPAGATNPYLVGASTSLSFVIL
jgi:hypothetical protein